MIISIDVNTGEQTELPDAMPSIEVPPTADQNKATASSLLSATDWTTIADVADPINSPYLTNQAEFIAYRNEIRKIAVNPVEGNLIWATVPKAIWG